MDAEKKKIWDEWSTRFIRWIRSRKTQTALVIVGLLVLVAGVAFGTQFISVWRDHGKLIVYALDVGQGDALFVRFPDGKTMLIDGGPDNSVVHELGRIVPFWSRHIDTILLTHPEADHVGGLPSVLERYTVGRVVMTGVLHTTQEYIQFLEMIREAQVPVTIIDRPTTETLPLGDGRDIRLEYLWPRESAAKKSVPALNNTAIVFRMVYGRTSFLFTGDIETPVEEALLDTPDALKSTVLKIGHHGSDTSTTDAFLRAVQPTHAFISVGSKNRFGHPSRRVLRKLERAGTSIHRTDQEGTIRITSDSISVFANP